MRYFGIFIIGVSHGISRGGPCPLVDENTFHVREREKGWKEGGREGERERCRG